MSEYEMSIATRPLVDVAREEIEVARLEGVDPMDIARTHQRLGYIIPQLLREKDDPRADR